MYKDEEINEEEAKEITIETNYVQRDGIKEVKNNLVIKIKNAFNNEIRYNKEELMSTKEGHSGLGIKSVKSVVSKYQGEIRMDITDNMFSVLIIIPFHP